MIIDKRTNPLKTVLFPLATRKALQTLFEQHGARLEVCDQEEKPYCLFHFPEGTKREREAVLSYHEHYKITLPDGFLVFQSVDQEGWCTIRFPIEEERT